MNLDGPDYPRECDYDVIPYTTEYDPSKLPFMQVDSIDKLLPWTDKYKDKHAKYHGKELGSIRIFKKEDEKREEIIQDTIQTELLHDKNTPCIDSNEGNLVLMWEKRRDKPKYE